MIRKAVLADIKQIAEIYKQLHLIHCEIRSDYYKKLQNIFYQENLRLRLNDNKYTIFLYEKNSEIIGYASLFIRNICNEITYEVKKCHIEEFAVLENYRGQGIGTELLEYIKVFGVQNECYSLELDVWYENYDAVDFYSLIGFEPRVIKMEMKLK